MSFIRSMIAAIKTVGRVLKSFTGNKIFVSPIICIPFSLNSLPTSPCMISLLSLQSWHLPAVIAAAATAAKSLQSCLTLCDPIDSSPPGSPVPGILQARTLEWVATSFSNAWKWKVKGKSLSRVWLLATPWTAAYQAPPSVGFSRQEYWIGMPLPSLPAVIGQLEFNVSD